MHSALLSIELGQITIGSIKCHSLMPMAIHLISKDMNFISTTIVTQKK